MQPHLYHLHLISTLPPPPRLMMIINNHNTWSRNPHNTPRPSLARMIITHAPPSSNQPVKQQPQLENGIDSIAAVAFPPQPRMQVVERPRPNDQLVVYAAPLPEANKMEAHLILIQAVGNPWRSGLFDCYQHPINAMIATVAPYVTFGQVAEIVDNGSTSYVTGATLYFYLFFAINHWNIGVRYRRRVRDAYQLAEMPLTDRLVRLVSGLSKLTAFQLADYIKSVELFLVNNTEFCMSTPLVLVAVLLEVAYFLISPFECECSGYVAEVRKRDEKIYWPFALDESQNKLEEQTCILPPLDVPKFRRWHCQNCLQEIGTKVAEKEIATVPSCNNTVYKSSGTCLHMTSHGAETVLLLDYPRALNVDISEGRNCALLSSDKQEKQAEVACSIIIYDADQVIPEPPCGAAKVNPCLMLEKHAGDTDQASSESDDILIKNSFNRQHDNSSGWRRRKSRKVRLLTDLLGANENNSTSNAMIDASTSIYSLSIPQGEVATRWTRPKTDRISGPNKKKNKKTSVDDGCSSLLPPQVAIGRKIQDEIGDADTGNATDAEVEYLRSMPQTVPFQSVQDHFAGKDLQLFLNSLAAQRKHDAKYVAPIQDVVMRKDVERKQHIGDRLFGVGVNCDINGKRTTHGIPFLSEKQNCSPRVEDWGSSLKQKVDFSGKCNTEKAIEVQELSEANRKHSDHRVDEVFEQGTSDDIPTEIVELMARNQYERCLSETRNDYHLSETTNDTRNAGMLDFTEVYANGAFRLLQEENSHRHNLSPAMEEIVCSQQLKM
ncbi:hypothetical protein AAG906_002629 [Vitis piasezkii]